MSTNFERSAGYSNIRIAGKSGQIEIPTQIMQERFRIKLFIRIPQAEYPESAVGGNTVTHFGLPIQDENVGDTVALTRIVENGHYIPGIVERPPLLSLTDIWTGYLTKVVETIPIEDIAPEFFMRTIGDIKNAEELRSRILLRYRRSLPTFTDDRILAQGVSIREIKLAEKLVGEIR